jgi:hypothetical protein
VIQAPSAVAPVYQTPAAYEEQPYVPFQGSWNARPYNDPAGDFVRPAQWNTVGGWLIAFSSIVFGIVAAIVSAIAIPSNDSNLTLATIVGGAIVALLVLFVFAELDRRALRRFGYTHTASILWMLLGPLIYLILRKVAIGREVRRGYAPLVTYAVIMVVSVIASVALPLFLASRAGPLAAAEFTSSLEQGLDENGASYTVECPPSIPTTIGSQFTCTATDAVTHTSHTLKIEVVTGSDGKPTVKLLSVTPPISK